MLSLTSKKKNVITYGGEFIFLTILISRKEQKKSRCQISKKHKRGPLCSPPPSWIAHCSSTVGLDCVLSRTIETVHNYASCSCTRTYRSIWVEPQYGNIWYIDVMNHNFIYRQSWFLLMKLLFVQWETGCNWFSSLLEPAKSKRNNLQEITFIENPSSLAYRYCLLCARSSSISLIFIGSFHSYIQVLVGTYLQKFTTL